VSDARLPDAYPHLTREDMRAALRYAADTIAREQVVFIKGRKLRSGSWWSRAVGGLTERMKPGAAALCCPWLPPFAEFLSRGSQVRVLPGAPLFEVTARTQE
jgi:hypothetical protein